MSVVGLCYTPCRSDTDGHRPTRLRSDLVGPPSATFGTPRTALHNLSRDTGDLLTSLSFLLYLLIFPMPRSDYLPRVFLMFSLIYFRSSSGSSINSSIIVGSTQMKNLVVFQSVFVQTLSSLPYDSTNNFQVPAHRTRPSTIARPLSHRKPSVIIGYLQNLSVTSGPYRKSRHKGIGSASPNSVHDSVVFVHGT